MQYDSICFEKFKKSCKETIHVIATDGFINQDCVTNKFGSPHLTYMCGTWHLFDSILPKCYRLKTFGLIKTYLQNMCYSKTESHFEEAFAKAMSILHQKPVCNENLEEHLRKFYNKHSTYASYILSKKGTRGCYGSSISESNHSSVLVHINDGVNLITVSVRNHTHTSKRFIFCQKKHINNWNSVLYVLYNESIQLNLVYT